MIVRTSTNYKEFKKMTGNRAINRFHVKQLAESISKFNYMQYQPVLVTSDNYIIDGQHRIEAAKLLKIPFFYITLPDADLNSIRLLNSNMKNWTVWDFIESYIITGNESYKILKSFCQKYEVPPTTGAFILAGKESRGKTGTGMLIKSGKFLATNTVNAEQLMNYMKEFESHTDKNVWRDRDFITAIIRMLSKGADKDRLIEKVKSSPVIIPRQSDYRQYILILQDIYNRKMSKHKLEII